MAKVYLVAGLLVCLTAGLLADDAVPQQPEARWWKGNIHTHTLWSDGNDFPEMVAEWYRTHDYNFLALSDHNVLSSGIRWMKVSDVQRRGGPDVLRKYRARFGGGWVETRGEPGMSNHLVRLKPLNEFRALVEQRGHFIMVQGEEITDRVLGKPVHMNATNVKHLVQPLGGATVREAISANLRAVQDQAARSGREMLIHLNHPNFGWAVTAEDLAAVTAERFFEVYNGHPAVGHLGDGVRPSVPRIWDIANTLRLSQLAAPRLMGVATDDSHKYHGKPGSHPGRGWVMVRSRFLTPEHLIRAMKRGDFYASSGVSLTKVHWDGKAGELTVSIQAEPGVTYTTDFVGTPRSYDRTVEPRAGKDGQPVVTTGKYSDQVGMRLARVTGPEARYRLKGDELYVRAVVTSSRPHPDPSFKDQHQQAWTQPFVPQRGRAGDSGRP